MGGAIAGRWSGLRSGGHCRGPRPHGPLQPPMAAEVGRRLPGGGASGAGPRVCITCHRHVPIKLPKQMTPPCGFIFSLPGKETHPELHHAVCLDLEEES